MLIRVASLRSSFLILIIISFILFSSAYSFCSNLAVKPVYDFFIKVTSEEKLSDEIVVVTIDDQSINKIGRWPWKRTLYTDIFEYLENTAGAKAIAFDSVLVSYGEEEDDEEFFKRFSKLNKVIPGVFFSEQNSFFKNRNEEKLNELFQTNFSIKVDDHRADKHEYKSCSYALEEVMSAATSLGSVLSHPGEDGIIRKAEHVFYYKNHYYPSLALAVFRLLNPESEIEIGEDYLKISDFSMPIRDSRFGYIKWYKSKPYKTYSAWRVIGHEDIEPSEFKDKIVVVGTTATALKDIKSTPLRIDYPGVYIQATLIDNLLNREFMTTFSKTQENMVLLGTLVLGFCAVFFIPPVFSSILLVFLGVGYFYMCLFFAYPNNIALDPITPIAFIICVAVVGYGYKYFIEDEKKRKTRNIIAKYVSKDIMESILSDIEGAKLGGKRSEISVLFVDIRNFTHISETLQPEKVSELLNEYFGQMIPIIFKYKGTVNKFVGDALLVIFGAPVENSYHPELAVKCALEMQQKAEEFENIDIGIGISTGEAFVGNIGSEERCEYTAIGNTVNIASRLESFNKIYKTNILISESTYHRTEDIIEAEEIDSVAVTQNSEPIKIFELHGLKP